MTITINVTISGVSELYNDLADRTPLHKSIAQHIKADTLSHFSTESAPDGRRWAPSQRALATGGRTLTDTRALKDSVVTFADHSTIIVGTDIDYGKYHEFGTRNMAQRQWLGFDDEEEILDIIEDYIMGN